jgi:pyruvate dehydrogenase E1 component alpha subunit
VFAKTSPVEHVADRAVAYGIPGTVLDGTDFEETYGGISAAVERARAGNGPTLVEAVISRSRGHHHFDSMKYLPAAVVQEMIESDGVPRFRAWLVAQRHATDAELTALDEKAAADIEQAWEFASNSPDPDVSELYSDVYATAN